MKEDGTVSGDQVTITEDVKWDREAKFDCMIMADEVEVVFIAFSPNF